MENSVMQLPQGEVIEPKIDFGNDPIYKELMKPTEKKALIAEKKPEEIEAEAINSGAEFEPETEEEQVVSPPPGKGSGDKAVTDDEYYESALTMLGGMDMLNVFLLPHGYMRAAFSREERDVIKKYSKRFYLAYKSKPDSKLRTMESEDIQDLFERWVEVRELVDKIPFEQHKMERAARPLAAILKKYAKKPGPEFEFFMCLADLYTPKIAPLAAGML